MGAGEKMLEGVAGNAAAQPNNGMHPTANIVAFMREASAIPSLFAAGDAGR